jgi:hypothetical protein
MEFVQRRACVEVEPEPVGVETLETGPVVVGRAGFEPATNGLKVRCSTS